MNALQTSVSYSPIGIYLVHTATGKVFPIYDGAEAGRIITEHVRQKNCRFRVHPHTKQIHLHALGANYTLRVNGRVAMAHKPVEVRPGDKLEIGDQMFTIKAEGGHAVSSTDSLRKQVLQHQVRTTQRRELKKAQGSNRLVNMVLVGMICFLSVAVFKNNSNVKDRISSIGNYARK